MKESVFHSEEFWKSALMNLPDNAFFELARSVFGKIKTPFSKQVLLGDLVKFLSREDIQSNVACYIDRNDARIISAVAALNNPAPGGLESFFSGEMSYAELHDIIVNLEERFIVYRFREETGPSRLALNPLLEPVLAPIIADNALLLPSVSPDEVAHDAPENQTPILDDRILAGLLSFVAEHKLFFRSEGKPRKRVTDQAKTVFPGLSLETVIGGLQGLGLFHAEGDMLEPDYRRFAEFGRLSRRERMEYCAAGIACFRDPDAKGSPWLLRSQLFNTASFIHQLLDSLEPERAYPTKTLMRLAYILNVNAVPWNGANGSLFEIMEQTGLLVSLSAEYLRLGPAAVGGDDPPPVMGTAAENDSEGSDSAALAMDTPFSLLVYPEIAYDDVIDLAGISKVTEAGMTVRFEINRDSAVNAFNRGVSADAMINLLKRLSLNRIDENLIWTIKDWEKRYGEVSIKRGLVLSLSPERRYLADTRTLSGLITETLAPGVYLLPETVEDRAAEALRKAGVDIIARGGGKTGGRGGMDSFERTGLLRNFFSSLGRSSRSASSSKQRHGQEGKKAEAAADAAASALIKDFHSILEQMRTGTKEERDELAARINRRLVLCESQLKDAVVRYEKLEARGLDYLGKAMIAKQAVVLQSPVEIELLGAPDKKGNRFYGIPRAVEKEGSDSVLIVIPSDNSGDDDGEPLRIPLGKISFLRRIKKSIFE